MIHTHSPSCLQFGKMSRSGFLGCSSPGRPREASRVWAGSVLVNLCPSAAPVRAAEPVPAPAPAGPPAPKLSSPSEPELIIPALAADPALESFLAQARQLDVRPATEPEPAPAPLPDLEPMPGAELQPALSPHLVATPELELVLTSAQAKALELPPAPAPAPTPTTELEAAALSATSLPAPAPVWHQLRA